MFLTGRDETAPQRLTQKYAGLSRIRVCGFVEEMSDLLAAADALVHSTAA